ncbi:DUF4174 domain-containing protein [Winogradskyella poriferorum]|uniref:DUF4174 domain-containing protein n=1 Tax=Winogradskyella poriferorum TaxID=307627 RepID=UPI003D65ABCE
MKTSCLHLFIAFTLCFSTQSMAQELKDYKWKNRLVLVIGNNTNNTTFTQQLEVLENDNQGLNERRLKLFKVLPNKYQLDEEVWVEGSLIFDKYNANKDPFRIILIGLDGGIKLSQSTVISKKDLFDLIDSMPMRSSELRSKN